MANAGNPQSVATPNVFQKSSGAMDAGLGLTGKAAMGPDIGRFMNPFQQGVTNTTLAGLDRSRQMAGLDINKAATAAGAFGGSRHGVLEAENNRNFYDSAGATLAGLNKDNFNTALGAGQNQQQVEMGAGGQFANLGQMLFGIGGGVNQNLNQQGAQNQNMVQQLIEAAKGQFGGFTGAPLASLSAPMAALGGANMGQNTSTTKNNPGLFQMLGTLLSAIPGA